MRYHSGTNGALARRAETLSADLNELAACMVALTKMLADRARRDHVAVPDSASAGVA